MNVIDIKNLTKYYGKSRGIIDVSFSIDEGEIFGFIGPNGAGKSTTIRILLGLIHQTSGTATVFGKDISDHTIRKEIGYLPSEVFYYENMRVIDLLNYSASFYKKDCSERIKSLAARMDLDLKKKIDDLSFGNKKKVGIVQGLIHSPKLIILDEPTSGLDPLMQQTFFKLIDEESKRGATVLFSSHVLSEVQRMCNRVAIIKEGRLVKLESVAKLNEGQYKKVRLEGNVQDSIASIHGVANFLRDPSGVSFIYYGNIVELIKTISQTDFTNIGIEEPDLEEIFLHYYEKEEQKK